MQYKEILNGFYKESIMLLFGLKFHLFYQVLFLWGGTLSEDRDLTTNSLVLATTISELHDSKTCKSDSENDATTENKHVLENDDKNARHDQKETYLEEENPEVSVRKLNSPQVDVKDVNDAIISPKQPEVVKGLSITVILFIVLSALITVLCLCNLGIFLWPKCRVCIAKLKGAPKNNLSTSDVLISNPINPYISDNPGQNVRDTDNASTSSDLFTSDIIKSRIHNILKGRTLQSDSCDNPGQNDEDTDNTSTSSDLFISNPKSRLYRVFKHDDVSLSSDSSNLRENVQETDNTSNSSDVYPSKILKSRIYRLFKKDVSLSSDSCNNQRQNAQETDNTSNSSDLFKPNIPKP